MPNSKDGEADIFTASISGEGTLAWANTVTSQEDDFSRGIAVQDGNLYLAGSLGGPAVFPGYALYPVPHVDKQDAFLCSMRAESGTTRWVRTLSGKSGDTQEAFDVTADIPGPVYVTGYFMKSLYAGADTIDTAGQEDVFVVSCSDSGEIRWVQTAGGPGHDYGTGISTTFSGEIYVGGYYDVQADFGSIPAAGDGGSNIFLAYLQLPCVDAAGGTLTASAGEICRSETVVLNLGGYLGSLRWESSPPGEDIWSPLAADNSATIALNPSSTADYRAFLESPGCAPDSSGVVRVTIHSPPAAFISGDTTRCFDGTPHLVRADLTGTAPWELSLRHNGTVDTLITGITSSPYFHPVTGDGFYEPVYIADSLCTGSVSGSATLSYQDTLIASPGTGGNTCGVTFALQASPTPDSGWWELDSGPGTAQFFPSGNTPAPVVEVSNYGSYKFRWTVTRGSCISGSVIEVHFFELPVIELIPSAVTCGPEYPLKVATSAGTGRWATVSGPG
ncbi:MAG: hypothetical protein EHM46_06300, partial [Bacteroidetes bacterium]